MSALAKIDKALIGGLEGEVSDGVARDNLAACGFGKDFNVYVSKLKARSLVGKYSAGIAAGNILAQGLLYRDMLEKAALVLSRDIESEATIEQKVLLVNALNQTVNTHSNLSVMELSAAEVVANGNKKTKRNVAGPQINSENTYVQVVTGPQSVADK